MEYIGLLPNVSHPPEGSGRSLSAIRSSSPRERWDGYVFVQLLHLTIGLNGLGKGGWQDKGIAQPK